MHMLKWIELSIFLALPFFTTWLGAWVTQILLGEPLVATLAPYAGPVEIARVVEKWWLYGIGMWLIYYGVCEEIKNAQVD